MIDVHSGEFINMIGQSQTIGREAQLDVRNGFHNLIKRRLGLLPIVTGIAGASDAEHRELRHIIGHRNHLAYGLIRREFLRDHTGAALIGAVIFAIAIIALNVARGRYGHMHAREIMMCLFRIAGMIFDLVPHRGIHIIRLGR